MFGISVKSIYKIAPIHLLPPIRAAEIVECVRKFVVGISQNLQSLSPCLKLCLNKSNH